VDEREFMRLLVQARASRDRELSEKFNRSLPLGDAMFDRWERAGRLGFAQEASIYDSALVYGDVSVGEHTWIGPNVLLDGSGGPLTIGAWCSVAAGVHIYTHDTVAWALTAGKAPAAKAPVTICDCCYVGPLSIVKAGVTIGTRSVIGANSYVNRDVAEQSVVAGSPARHIGNVSVTAGEVRIDYLEGDGESEP
jgi:acetyltransferase-like isoleucine patch superfamily enzyme